MAASVDALSAFPPRTWQPRTECLPPDGVYATRIGLADGAYQSITNIGMRPTFAEPERTFETHIFDFNRDIYGQEVKLEARRADSARAEIRVGAGPRRADRGADLQRAKEILATV